MADKTGIEWTDATWNPVVGCTIVSPGCKNCYAMAQAARIVRMADGAGKATHYAGTVEAVKGKPVWTGTMALAPDSILTQPLRWKAPRRIFVNSMGDLFHEDVPDEWIDRVFAVMALAPQHTFQILTKRSARMRAYVSQPELPRAVAFASVDIPYPDELVRIPSWPLRNVWLGVSAEDQRRWDERTADLKETPAAIRFVSAEPLLGPIVGDMSGIDWVIVGGESGPSARSIHPQWVRGIRDQCATAGTTFFFKQWGEWAPSTPEQATGNPRSGWKALPGHPHVAKAAELYPEAGAEFIAHVGKKAAGRLLDGIEHNAMPEVRHV